MTKILAWNSYGHMSELFVLNNLPKQETGDTMKTLWSLIFALGFLTGAVVEVGNALHFGILADETRAIYMLGVAAVVMLQGIGGFIIFARD